MHKLPQYKKYLPQMIQEGADYLIFSSLILLKLTAVPLAKWGRESPNVRSFVNHIIYSLCIFIQELNARNFFIRPKNMSGGID